MYQIKTVLGGQRLVEVPVGPPVDWAEVLSTLRSEYEAHAENSEKTGVQEVVTTMQKAQWVIDRGNPVTINLNSTGTRYYVQLAMEAVNG